MKSICIWVLQKPEVFELAILLDETLGYEL